MAMKSTCCLNQAVHLHGVKIKSAETWNNAFEKALKQFSEQNAPLVHAYVVYRGEYRAFSDGVNAISFRHVADIFGQC